jgi:hypothetical protein
VRSVTDILEDETLTASERVEKVFIEAPAIAAEEMKEEITARIAEGLKGFVGATKSMGLAPGQYIGGAKVEKVEMGKEDGMINVTMSVPVGPYFVATITLGPEEEGPLCKEEIVGFAPDVAQEYGHCVLANAQTLEVTNPWSGAMLPVDAAWAAAAMSVNVPTLATEVEPAGIAAIAAQFSSGAEKLPMDMQWALGRCGITPIAGEKLTAQDELYMKVVRRDQDEVNRKMAERLGVMQGMLTAGMVSQKTARKELGIQTDEDIEEMAEEEDIAWRAAIMGNTSLTVAERVERLMMGRPRLPGSAEKIVGAMNGFSKRLADEKKAAERFDEEERARAKPLTGYGCHYCGVKHTTKAEAWNCCPHRVVE